MCCSFRRLSMSLKELGRTMVSKLYDEANIVSPELPISKVAGILRDKGVYEVFVQIGDRVGMISTRDILKISNRTKRMVSSTVRYVPKISLNESVENAARIMEQYRFRALPIVENKKIVGQINALAIIKSLNRGFLSKIKVNQIMTSNPIIMDPQDSTDKARHIMIRRRIDHIPIVEGIKIRGIVTSSDIVFRMLPIDNVGKGDLSEDESRRLDFPLIRISNSDPITCNIEENLDSVFDNITKNRSTYSLVTLWNEINDIVTNRDFLKLIKSEKSNLEIPAYLIGLPKHPFEAEATSDKFNKTVIGLRKAFPDIMEIRSIIKTKSIRSDRRRYEVKLIIYSPNQNYAFSEEGYDLPSLYDVFANKVKRLMTRKNRIIKPTKRRNEE